MRHWMDICGDGVDNDCDGSIDGAGLAEICGDGVDNDCDGEVDEIEGEICGDGVDNDCDGSIDERYLFSETLCGVADQNEGQLVFFECTDNDVWNTEGLCVNLSSSALINDAPALTTPLGQLVEQSPYCEIESLSIYINIEHTWIGDLVLTLISPSGERVTLQQRQFGSLDTLEVNYPGTQEVQDQEAFNNLSGSKANGLWLLDVIDLGEQDTGRIVEWSLNIECSA